MVCRSWSVRLLVTQVDCVKMDEDIDLPFEAITPLDPGYIFSKLWWGYPQRLQFPQTMAVCWRD